MWTSQNHNFKTHFVNIDLMSGIMLIGICWWCGWGWEYEWVGKGGWSSSTLYVSMNEEIWTLYLSRKYAISRKYVSSSTINIIFLQSQRHLTIKYNSLIIYCTLHHDYSLWIKNHKTLNDHIAIFDDITTMFVICSLWIRNAVLLIIQ